jgi:hypothetical protein
VLIHTRPVREDGWAPQEWTYYFAPTSDGFDLLWVVKTFDEGLNEFYCVQQCFRMSGRTNEAWRREIAETPAFSEYDYWSAQEQRGESPTSLSYALINRDWRPMPATHDHVAYRTALGSAFDRLRQKGDAETIHLPPYGPSINGGIIDSGLVTRTDPAGEWVCALYWEQTTHITNHHPADCLHAVVNLGPVPPHGKRLVRGKIYWAKMTKQELLATWKRDFGM